MHTFADLYRMWLLLIVYVREVADNNVICVCLMREGVAGPCSEITVEIDDYRWERDP